tara:strand:- start:467 stop:775 length:309 start_codon:yes stop_codon:yes gene_type:complete
MTTKSPRFAEINPATNKVWKLTELHQALVESQAQAQEFKAIANAESDLTWGDVQRRFIMPAIRKDQKERPLFWQDARCGFTSLINLIKETYAELRKPLFTTN